jgi:hypothetical protein
MWECVFFFSLVFSFFLSPFFVLSPCTTSSSVPVVKLGTYVENVNNLCSPDFFFQSFVFSL